MLFQCKPKSHFFAIPCWNLFMSLHKTWLMTSQIHTHTTPFVRDYLGRLVPEETHTHSHRSWSSDIHYQLPPSTMIYSILLVQFTCLTVLFDNLFPGPLWSSSWSLTLCFIPHTFLHPVIFFFATHVHTIAGRFAVIPMLCHLFFLISLLWPVKYYGIICSNHVTF